MRLLRLILICNLATLSAAAAQYATHGIGNSFNDRDRFVSGQAQIIWADATEVTFCSSYDEVAHEMKIYGADRQDRGRYQLTHFPDGNTATDGRAITGNASYVWATTRTTGAISRWSRATREPLGRITGITSGRIGGFAARGNRLYVSDTSGNRVVAYDVTGNNVGTYVSEFPATNPGHLAVDASGRIWVAEFKSTAVRLRHRAAYLPVGSTGLLVDTRTRAGAKANQAMNATILASS